MAAARHNLSRRALLGAGVGACLGPGVRSGGLPAAAAPASAAAAASALRSPDGRSAACARWARTLAAYRRSEARIAAFKAEEALLPAERRRWPACRPLEQRFGDLNDRRFAVLRRLLRLPVPDLAALALKLELAVADQAWELTGAEDCLAVIAADARRLSDVR
jgi:hypothetical protein